MRTNPYKNKINYLSIFNKDGIILREQKQNKNLFVKQKVLEICLIFENSLKTTKSSRKKIIYCSISIACF